MARGLIGKFVRGAAAAGVPMMLEEHRVQNQAKRDALLQSYAAENAEAQRGHQTSERLGSQEFTAGENAAVRGQQQGQFDATMALNRENAETQREQFQASHSLNTAQFGLLAQQAAQALEQGNLGLVQGQRIEALRQVLVSPDSTEEQMAQAAQMLQSLMSGDRAEMPYLAVTIPGETDELGQPISSSRVGSMDRRDGTFKPYDPNPVDDNDPLGIFQ